MEKTFEVQRRLDELGRVVLPIDMRRTLGLVDGSTVNMRCEGGKIILENAAACCKLCHRSDAPLTPSGPDLFCADCIARIKAL